MRCDHYAITTRTGQSKLATRMSTLWLHVELVPSQGDMVSIGRDEARHAFGARRLHAGDMVTLFDGCGGLAQARLSETRTRDGEYLVELITREHAPSDVPQTTIAFAVPKGDRLSTLLDLTTQAGVSRLVPIDCARSVVDAGKRDRGERWHRVIAESTKVAKRAWMPELALGGTLLHVARAERARGAALAVAECATAAPLIAWRDSLPATQPRTIFIGPEGGFEPAELDAMRALNATMVSLGPCVMRVEMAAVAACVLLRS